MDESCEVRRSGRHRTRPLEFWNFEKPEDVTCNTIIYNEIELKRCSVFELFSRSYYQGSRVNSSDVKEKANPPTGKAAKKIHSNSHSPNKPARKLDISMPQNSESSPVLRNRTGSDDTGVKAKKTTTKSRSSKNPARKAELGTSESAESSPVIRNSACPNDTGVAGKTDPPTGKAAKKTTKSLSSKQPSRKSEVGMPKNAENSPIIRNPRSVRQRGQKRKLDYTEMSEDGTIVNGEDHSLPLKSRSNRRSVSVQKSPGKARTQSLYNDRDSACSPRFKKKKEEKEGDKSSPRKAAGSSPRLTRRGSGSRGLDKQQVMEGRKAAEISESNNNNNNRSDVTTPSQSQSNFYGSFFNDSVRQHSRSRITGRDTMQNTTAFEQPSFRNVLSSTAIEVTGPGVFKVPRLPPRKHMAVSKVTSYSIDPSMVTIPEEEEECEKPGQKQMDVEEPQKDREAGNLGEREVTEATTTTTATATATVSARKRGRPRKSHTALTATVSEGHRQRKESQGQEDTVEGGGSVRRSSRVRTGRLEFWNFEKVEVERQADGEVKVIHHKQDSSMQIQKRVIDCSSVSVSQLGQGITLTEDLLKVDNSTAMSNKPGKPSKKSRAGSSIALHPALSPKQVRKSIKALSKWSPGSSPQKSPNKRRLFSPNLNYFDEPAVEESKTSRISVGDMKVTVVGKMEFNNLRFFIMEKKDYRCYVARSLHNKEKTIFNSFLFLERGNIVWHSQARMTIYVIEGLGKMHVISEDQTQHHQLQAQVTVQCPKESKISVRKDGRCRMLKLYICLVRDPVVAECS